MAVLRGPYRVQLRFTRAGGRRRAIRSDAAAAVERGREIAPVDLPREELPALETRGHGADGPAGGLARVAVLAVVQQRRGRRDGAGGVGQRRGVRGNGTDAGTPDVARQVGDAEVVLEDVDGRGTGPDSSASYSMHTNTR